MMINKFNNKLFYGNVFKLVMPMALISLIDVGVSSADIIMLGKLSEKAMSAVSLANQFQFVLVLVLYGIGSGSMVLNAQYWGKKDTDTIAKVAGIAGLFAFSFALFFAFLAIFFPTFIMSLFTKDKELIILGISYLRIIGFAYLLQSLTVSLLAILKSMEIVKISTFVYAISFMVNCIINYILIFGLLGFPALGVKGAAIGTLVARIVEISIVLIFLRSIKSEFNLQLKHFIRINRILLKDFIKYSWPIILNELFWSLSISAGTAIYGHVSTELVAANSIAHVTKNLFLIFSFGIANATAILVGKKIGEKDFVSAKIYARKLINLGLAVSLIGAILLFLTKNYIISFYNLSDLSKEYLRIMLNIMCFYSIAQVYSLIMIVGIFRAGGDSMYGMMVDIITMWGGSLILSFLAAFVFKLDPQWIILCILSDEFFKIPFCHFRYKKEIWLKDITRNNLNTN